VAALGWVALLAVLLSGAAAAQHIIVAGGPGGANPAAENLIASDLKYPDRTGEPNAVTSNPGQRYYYFLKADEVVLIRCCDSALEGGQGFSAHIGFDVPPG
jgi:hypothetical protein